jgi:hypothetical protein
MPSSRSELARRIARAIGLRTFKGHPDRAALLNDCESSAWELEQRAPPRVTPACIAWMAVKRVRVGRQFKESVRSITTSRFDKRSKRPKNLRQIQIHLHDIASVEQPPSLVAPGWLDYGEWLSRLDARKRAIAEALAAGGKTGEVAAEFGVSPGRIAQMRREFEKDWAEFQHAN